MIPKKRLPFTFAKRHGAIAIKEEDNYIHILHRQKITQPTLSELRRFFAKPLQLTAIEDKQFDALLVTSYETSSQAAMQAVEDLGEDLDLYRVSEALGKTQDLMESEDDAPIIRFINALLSQAIKELASDIHIETFEDSITIRFRVDGVLRKVLEPPRHIAPLLISRIKVMAKLDIAEKRLPQDGRIGLRVAGRAIDVRVSTLPANHGERLVLRLLDKSAGLLRLQGLGLSDISSSAIKQLLAKPHGIILATGPTGAGKTTTLYALLSELNKGTRNILTVEDPIEYELPGIGQTQVNTKIDMSFAKGLRAILRQDPDIVMVGEIRDTETAHIAVQASLTGHLVLSTLHTNTAIGAIARLRDMGVERFLLSASLIGLLAQRLVRVLCPHCKKAREADESERSLLSATVNEKIIIYDPIGCDACNHSGYRGRIGIYEVVVIDNSLRQLIHDDANELTIEQHVRTTTPSIRQDGCRLVRNGLTTIEEVIQATIAD